MTPTPQDQSAAPADATIARRRVTAVGRIGRSVCAGTSDGHLRCWGNHKASPVEVSDGPKGAVAITGGWVLDERGEVWSGESVDSWDQLSLPGTRLLAANPQLEIGYAMSRDGRIHANGQAKWFERTLAQTASASGRVDHLVDGVADALELAAGGWRALGGEFSVYGCARVASGDVLCWTNSLKAAPIAGLKAKQIVTAGMNVVCGLDTKDRTWCWWNFGMERFPTLVEVTALTGAARLTGDEGGAAILNAVGAVCGIFRDGSAKCVPLESGVFGTPAIGAAVTLPTSPVTGVAFARGAIFATLRDGDLVAWGSNDVGQLGDGTLTDRTEPVHVAHILDDILPPPANGYGHEQQSAVEMDWTGLPSRCKAPTVVGDVHAVSAYAIVAEGIGIQIASYRLDPTAPYRNPRGEQLVAHIGLSNYGPSFEPLPLTRGTYLVNAQRGRRAEAYQTDGHDPETFHPKLLAEARDSFELTFLDSTWVCGTLHHGRASTQIAAKIVPVHE